MVSPFVSPFVLGSEDARELLDISELLLGVRRINQTRETYEDVRTVTRVGFQLPLA